ncbi:MAG TPA: DUF4157 domain-containing protein [Candidatus Limnocylindria bacterium]|nr:DUF4157 domain-containing protein [Candidatus Limnocylindria bacterium]
MFELEPDVAQRRAAPEKSSPSTDAAPSRPLGMHDAASLLHLQRTVGNAGVVQMLAEDREAPAEDEPSPVHDVVGKGGGAPLDEGTRSSMESSFGQDFSDVRVHTDEQASKSAAAVGANAYTVGSDIVFRGGHFDSSSPTGQRTIAHELSHVVQQRSGPVEGTDAPGGIKLSSPDDRFERAADATADQVVSRSTAAPQPTGTAASSLQLEASDEEAEVPVQREEAMPEEELEE